MLTWTDAQKLKRGEIIYQELKVKLKKTDKEKDYVFLPWKVIEINDFHLTLRAKNNDEMDIPKAAFPMTNLYLDK